MRDPIIAAYLKDFADQFGLSGENEAAVFERFVNYCVLSKHQFESFEPEDVSVGGGGDLGLDGIGILVNDHLVLSNEDVDFFKNNLRRLDAQFVFIQAKTSPHFEAADIGTFVAGVRQFFASTTASTANDKVQQFRQVREHIFDSSIHMDRSPTCKLYYVTTGIWKDDPDLRTRIAQGIQDLQQTGLFSSVDFAPLDAEGLKRIHRELTRGITREIFFEKHTILPQIAGVQEAYIGIVPCPEYLKLICDDEGILNRRLFYDNVRDFQGNNAVNMEIEATTQDSAQNDRFALLNNGVTIVARDATKVGAKFRLRDYQIVNGCQTSHVLYFNRQHLTDKVFLPLKLIVTVDSEITNQIIQGTNRQTEVKLEAFESLAPFQKKLEELYTALGRDRKNPLYYERRSKQYEHLAVGRDRIISLATQVKCFVAMFLDEPHSTHRYYGELLRSYRNRLFADSHSLMPYFVSGAALAAIERLFAQGRLPRAWKAMKYQLLMVFRAQNQPFGLPPLHSKNADKYCEALLKVLDDEARTETAFRRAGDLAQTTRKTVPSGTEAPERRRVFTTSLLQAVGHGNERAATTERTSGTVKWFSDIKGYGFIEGDDGTDRFVHLTSIVDQADRTLRGGQRVKFNTVAATRGPQAVDVEILAE